MKKPGYMVTGWTGMESKFDAQWEQKIFIFSTATRPDVRSTSFLSSGHWRNFLTTHLKFEVKNVREVHIHFFHASYGMVLH